MEDKNRELSPEELEQGTGGNIVEDWTLTDTDRFKKILKTELDPVKAPLPFPQDRR